LSSTDFKGSKEESIQLADFNSGIFASDFKESFLMKYVMFTVLMITYLAHSKGSDEVIKLRF